MDQTAHTKTLANKYINNNKKLNELYLYFGKNKGQGYSGQFIYKTTNNETTDMVKNFSVTCKVLLLPIISHI